MSFYAASAGLVLDAVTSPTPSPVNSTHLEDSPKNSLIKLARTRSTPNHAPNPSESAPALPASKAPKSRPSSLTPLFSVKGGKLQHGYPRSLAPYPSNYDRSVIDCDVLDQTFLAGLHAGNPSMLPHVDLRDPITHPRKTLDLGCGSGAWIISAASLWPQTRFVGFDLVPQITNLSVFEETSTPDNAVPPSRRFSLTQKRSTKTTRRSGLQSGSTPTHRRLSDRVRFVHGNFLINGLPFEDGEFDHVRIAGIARGVPENKWDCLLAEVHRVLCNGGHLEMIEEDIIFPILPRRVDAPAQRKASDQLDEDELFYRRPTHVLRPSTSSAGSSSSSGALHITKKESDMSHSRTQSTLSLRTSTPPQPIPASILAQDPSADTNSTRTGSIRSFTATKKPRTAGGIDKPLPPPPSFKSSAFSGFGSHPEVSSRPSLGQMSSYSGDILRVSGTPKTRSKGLIRPASAQSPQKPGHNVHSMAFAIIGRRPMSPKDSRQPRAEQVVTAPPPKPAPPPKQPVSSKVPRSQSVEAVTPHEHTVIEVLFNSVFEGRFINTSPTAILPSYLNTYFKNLIASPRVDMPTPPAPKGRVKDIFGTEDVNMVPLKPTLKSPPQPTIVNRYPAPQIYEQPRTLSRSASIPVRPTGQIPHPRADQSTSSESEESEFAYWSVRSLATPTTPPEQSKGIAFVKGEEHPGENYKEVPPLSLLTMFDEEDDAREAITSPTKNWARLPPETETAQAIEPPITLDAALAAIERHDHFYSDPVSAFRRRSVDVGSLKRTYQRKPVWQAEKHVCQSYTRVKARDSVGSGLCLVLPRALFGLDERDMALHLRKSYMGVIACREAMWEELQRRAKTVTDERGVPYRTTLLDRVQWSSQERLMSDAEKFDLLFERFENDMRQWCSVGSSLSEQLWTQNDSPFAALQQRRLKRKVSAKSEFNEPLVGRDISRILRVFVAHKLEDGSPLGRRGSRI